MDIRQFLHGQHDRETELDPLVQFHDCTRRVCPELSAKSPAPNDRGLQGIDWSIL